MRNAALESISQTFAGGHGVPYLGPGVLSLGGAESLLPSSPHVLARRLTAKSSVPHKIKDNLGAAAQFIENFKHRRTVSCAMTDAFNAGAEPTALHNLLMNLPALPLVVHAWYDDLPQKALRARSGWGMAQGVSQAEHSGSWVHYFDADGSHVGAETKARSADWRTLLYQPFGSVWPARNFLVSDSDFVEVLTEIDIQTPIPEPVQQMRRGKSFIFLGCRFATQVDRQFARQIMKRSSERHWTILPEEPTRNERRFMEQYNIERIAMTLEEFVAALASKQRVS